MFKSLINIGLIIAIIFELLFGIIFIKDYNSGSNKPLSQERMNELVNYSEYIANNFQGEEKDETSLRPENIKIKYELKKVRNKDYDSELIIIINDLNSYNVLEAIYPVDTLDSGKLNINFNNKTIKSSGLRTIKDLLFYISFILFVVLIEIYGLYYIDYKDRNSFNIIDLD